MAAAKDVRIIIIKLADKLHNMRTLNYVPREKQLRIAKDALLVYVPIAHKLGIHSIRFELEDLAFKYIEPKKWAETTKIIEEKRASKEEEIERVIELIKKAAGPNVEFVKSYKSAYSVSTKMRVQGKAFDEIYDFIILKILCDSVQDCYSELGVVHTTFRPIPIKFKDHIAVPKDGIIQDLRTTVIGPNAKPIKMYISTRLMDEIASNGVIACMLLNTEETNTLYNERISWLSKALKGKATTGSSKKFMQMLNIETVHNLFYVFGPTGEIIELPRGSTALDFAYKLYPQKAHLCKSAIINGRYVPLWQELMPGNIVEMLFAKKAMINNSWINYAKCASSISQLKEAIKNYKKEPAKQDTPKVQTINISITALDRVGLFANISDIIAEKHINIRSANVGTNKKKRIATCKFIVEVQNAGEIKLIVDKVSKLKGITKVNFTYAK